MSAFININGRLTPCNEAGISPDNRAFRYGYGLFETMLVKDGVVRLARYHWERLFEGLALLQIHTSKFLRGELEQELVRTVRRAGLERLCRVRLQVYAGDGGLYDGDDFKAGYVVEVFPIEPDILKLNEAGLMTGISGIVRHCSPFAHVKASNALPYALAARQAKKALWNDALLLNDRGNVTESTIANIFAISAGKIFTPPLSEGCIAGVMRRHLLSVLPAMGYEVEERPFYHTIPTEADGFFLSNAIRGIRWIRTIGNHTYLSSLAPELHLKAISIL